MMKSEIQTRWKSEWEGTKKIHFMISQLNYSYQYSILLKLLLFRNNKKTKLKMSIDLLNYF